MRWALEAPREEIEFWLSVWHAQVLDEPARREREEKARKQRDHEKNLDTFFKRFRKGA